jgi:hypothetical protein
MHLASCIFLIDKNAFVLIYRWLSRKCNALYVVTQQPPPPDKLSNTHRNHNMGFEAFDTTPIFLPLYQSTVSSPHGQHRRHSPLNRHSRNLPLTDSLPPPFCRTIQTIGRKMRGSTPRTKKWHVQPSRCGCRRGLHPRPPWRGIRIEKPGARNTSYQWDARGTPIQMPGLFAGIPQ